MNEERIIRVPLPVQLIRQLDALVAAGTGGYTSRAEFVREAIEVLVLETTYPFADEKGAAPSQAGPAIEADVGDDGRAHSNSDMGGELTVVRAPSRGWHVDRGDARIVDEPLYGLHNRDYPSVWACQRLAELSREGALRLDEFLSLVTEEAWRFGEHLRELEENLGQRLTQIFPTNREKPQSAEEGFRAFAIGDVLVRPDGIEARGPLFAWRAAQILGPPGAEPEIAMTEIGYELLESLDGLSIETPHKPKHARAFLDHLQQHAPQDLWGFRTVVRTVDQGATRQQVLDDIRLAKPDWTDAQAETNAAGYISRCREWGLVEPRQTRRRYLLTDLGQTVHRAWTDDEEEGSLHG